MDWGFHLILVSRTPDLNNGLTERKKESALKSAGEIMIITLLRNLNYFMA